MAQYDYFEHETLPGVKMVVFHHGHDNYHSQLVDGVELFYEQRQMTGEQVRKLGKYYGFEVSNPNRRNPLVDFQWAGHREW